MMKTKQETDNNKMQFNKIEDFPLGTKGVPFHHKSVDYFELKTEQISFPCAVIKKSALDNNLAWMQAFANHYQVKFCPHGKTTMSPALFKQQLDCGAWGITVATATQGEIAVQSGAQRLIIANQIVGLADMNKILSLITNKGVTIFICVDNAKNVVAWQDAAANMEVILPTLIEIGVAGGRCGCRNHNQAKALADIICNTKNLSLAGIELYEGVISSDNAEKEIRDFLQTSIHLLKQLKQQHTLEQVIITAAGSAWYDVVAETFSQLKDITGVIRPGCYAIHDTGIYDLAQKQVQLRAKNNQGYASEFSGDLRSSLELWAYVISTPEVGTAIVGAGKRDVAFDAGLPIIERVVRSGKELPLPSLKATKIMDQHLFIEDTNSQLQVGDIVVMSTSHPCLTFDKWRYIGIKDEKDCIHYWINTCF
ncbi:MAG: alanine racemase [Ostreibacterium sp.]